MNLRILIGILSRMLVLYSSHTSAFNYSSPTGFMICQQHNILKNTFSITCIAKKGANLSFKTGKKSLFSDFVQSHLKPQSRPISTISTCSTFTFSRVNTSEMGASHKTMLSYQAQHSYATLNLESAIPMIK